MHYTVCIMLDFVKSVGKSVASLAMSFGCPICVYYTMRSAICTVH